MAIIKQTKNIQIITSKKDVIMTGNLTINTQNKMIFDAIENNLELNSIKKVKANGRG